MKQVALGSVVVALASGVFGGCVSDAADPESESGALAPPQAGGEVPRSCSDQLEERILNFLSAYSEGRASDAAEHFADGENFAWYSDSDRRVGMEEASDRNTLEEYFKRQHAAGDRLRLVSVVYGGYESVRDLVHFSAIVSRDDVEYPMKGALECRSMRFVVWSVGVPFDDAR